MRIFESHCHLNHRQFEGDFDAALARARAVGVSEILLIGYDLESSRQVVSLADPEQGLYATAGIHPHDAATWSTDTAAELRALLAQPGVVALGEIGLDFYRDLSPREAQSAAFRDQLDIAVEVGLPIVVHTRDSVAQTLEVLEPYARQGLTGVLHCWSGTPQEAAAALDLGFYLGVGGVLTYKNPGALPEVVRAAPLDRLLLETDSPYLAPTPYRGKRNEPAYLPLVAEAVAALKETSSTRVAEETRRAAERLFRLRLPW